MLVLASLAVNRLTLVCVCACSCLGVSISYVESLKFKGGAMVDMVREYWSWKFWSAGPIFSLENMVRLCKNWSGLKDARFTSSFLNRTQHDSSSTKGSLGNSQRTLEKS